MKRYLVLRDCNYPVVEGWFKQISDGYYVPDRGDMIDMSDPETEHDDTFFVYVGDKYKLYHSTSDSITIFCDILDLGTCCENADIMSALLEAGWATSQGGNYPPGRT